MRYTNVKAPLVFFASQFSDPSPLYVSLTVHRSCWFCHDFCSQCSNTWTYFICSKHRALITTSVHLDHHFMFSSLKMNLHVPHSYTLSFLITLSALLFPIPLLSFKNRPSALAHFVIGILVMVLHIANVSSKTNYSCCTHGAISIG